MTLTDGLEKIIARNFCNLGTFIGNNSVQVIIVMLTASFLMSLGIFRLHEVNNVRMQYSPKNAPSRIEHDIAMEFLRQNGILDPAYMLIEANDHGSLLRNKYRKALMQFVRQAQTNVTVQHKGQIYSYNDLCEPFCEINTGFIAFLQLYDQANEMTHTYPNINLFGSQIFIGNNAYGVTLEEGTNVIRAFTTAVFQLFVSAPEQPILHKWQKAVIKFSQKKEFALLNIILTSDSLVSAEVRRMGTETAPLLIGSVFAVILFVVINSFRANQIISTEFRGNAVRSKPFESFIGSIIPLLSILISTGMLSACGLGYQSIVVASYFLGLSVGVDDLFIILRAWDRSNTEISVPERLSKTLEDAGPSITISSLTNALSFGIGIFSSTPAICTFSIYSCSVVLVCYIYQLVLFSAVLALSGYREQKNHHSILWSTKIDPNIRSELVEKMHSFQVWIIKSWSYAITQWFTRVIIIIIMAFYYYVSFLGIRRLEAKILLDKMALPDSYLHNFQHIIESTLRTMQPITVFVMNPGNLSNLERIKSLVWEFEHSIDSYGNESTFFWLKHYEEYLLSYNEIDYFTYTEIPSFLKSAPYFFLGSFIQMNETACYDNHPECITAFFFATDFHKVIKYNEMIPAVRDWRRIAAKYSDYRVYPYSEHASFVDQTITIESTLVWSSLAVLFCTATICFIFIPNVASIGCAVYSVFSISFGIFGILSHFGVDLDPITMAAFLMAIGFSVDYMAHISCHYYKSKSKVCFNKLKI
ncbi:unnamed protein product [Thelazia callipaeda]|uniref:SSD domain-containing protein n=1 Tax=Thelazia callipaeda TaxID=103827 RepID=A0A0N5DB02_THECL|nr:unnamed protein product [Thelazia callipaeda]